jgi:hypothetical protein
MNENLKELMLYIVILECLTTKTGCYSKPMAHCDLDNKKAYPNKYQKHTPTGYKLMVIVAKRYCKN